MNARLVFCVGWLWLAWSGPIVWAQLPSARTLSTYYGEMDAGPRVFRFLITTQASVAGTWSGELRSLDEGDVVFKLANLIIDDKTLQFELTHTQAKYSGNVEDSSTKINSEKHRYKGQWTQNGSSYDLNFHPCEEPPVDKPNEVWIGDLKAGFQSLTMQFRVYEKDGIESVLFDSLTQRTGGYKAIRKIEGDSVEISVDTLRGKFQGHKIDAQSIQGKWSQGIPLELKLTRVDLPQKPQAAIVKRPQTPKPPFPYDMQTVKLRSTKTNIELEGTLTIPQSSDPDKKFAVAVLVTGSGPQDRDESLFGHKPFWVLADYLSRRGIAVLRYDDRGVGNSTGEFAAATSHDFAIDAASAVDYLMQHPRIDSQRIGIIGHSEGGIIASMVASEHPGVAWIVLMACPGVNGEQILYSQGKLMIEAEGGTQEMVQRQRIVQESTFEAVKSMNAADSIDRLVDSTTDQVIEKAMQRIPAPDNKSATVEPGVRMIITNLVKANLQAMANPWFRNFATQEPGPILEKVQCPVLAMNGENDVQVDPKLNLPKIEASLRSGGNKNFQIIELPGLNHLFQGCNSGALSKYESTEETLSPIALKTIGDWLAQLTE